MPESPYPEVPVDDARATVMSAVAPLAQTVRPFTDAAGLVLARAVRAVEPMPPFAASAKDGYAVVAGDGPGRRTLVGEVRAGRPPGVAVRSGTVARITTGAPLPRGADAVVMVEQTHADGDDVFIDRAVEPGADVRPVGQDYDIGEELLPRGSQLGPTEIGLLAAVGATDVTVHPRPRVAVFSSGNELVEPGAPLGPGQIRDSNRFALAEAARAAGAEVAFVGTIGDSLEDVSQIAAAAADVDVVVTAGGVSMGDRDHIKPWLSEHGDMVFGRVRVKPGKPLTFALVDGTPVFALPGFPVSAMVSFELFVRPALRRMAGSRSWDRPVWHVLLAHDVRHSSERTEFQRAVVRLEGGTPTARTTGFQGSARLLSLAGANALLRLDNERGHTPAGTYVDAVIIGPVAAGGEGGD
jgi:molybdenum cofactor synthesis domain-containing protein